MSNSPETLISLAGLFENFAQVIKNETVPGLKTVVRAAEQATAILYCATLTAKRSPAEIGFQSIINEARGNGFGARLINWTMRQLDFDIAADLKVAWSGMHQHMANSLEVMFRDLEPVGVLTVEQTADWIRTRGGLGKLSMAFLNYRREEKDQRERDRLFGIHARKLIDAQEAGFETIQEHEDHVIKVREEERVLAIKSKFGQIKKMLVKNGVLTVSPMEGQILISSGGKLYVLSDEDEYTLLSCAASIL
jgi:hypothetical protein